MQISDWLDIAISVLLVWFLFAIVVSAINEGIAGLLAVRSKQLWRALAQLIDGTESPTGLLRGVTGLPMWPGRPAEPHAGGGAPIIEKLYATNAIQGLENRTARYQKTRIHNIPASVFSQSLLELAMSTPGKDPLDQVQTYVNELPNIPLKPQLTALLATAHDDVDQFRAGVERWFDGQMTRVSQLYRTQVRVVLAMLGIAVAVIGFGFGMRSDSLRLVSDLQHDQNLRSLVVGAATETAKTDLVKAGGCDAATAVAKPAMCQLRGVASLKQVDLALHGNGPAVGASLGGRLGFLLPWQHWYAFLGVIITGIAISFGSSFWFSVLKRVVGLRSSP
jgi:hypothetical protein